MVLKHLVGYMAGHSDQNVSLKWKGMHSGLLRDYECEEPALEAFSDADWAADRNTRRSVSGGAISMEDAWCTHHQGLRRLCHCQAQSRKHMLPLQLSWMPSSLGPFFVGYFKCAFSCISTWINQLQEEFCHVEVLDV